MLSWQRVDSWLARHSPVSCWQSCFLRRRTRRDRPSFRHQLPKRVSRNRGWQVGCLQNTVRPPARRNGHPTIMLLWIEHSMCSPRTQRICPSGDVVIADSSHDSCSCSNSRYLMGLSSSDRALRDRAPSSLHRLLWKSSRWHRRCSNESTCCRDFQRARLHRAA